MNEIETKSVLIFDKDDTITSTKTPITSDMARVLSNLSSEHKIVIVSGSSWNILQDQIIKLLPENTFLLNWFFLPAGGSQLFYYENGGFVNQYDHSFDKDEFNEVKTLLLKSLTQLDKDEMPKRIYSEQIENRGGQITLSVLGQEAPKNEKIVWDADRKKRQKMTAWLRPLLSNFEVKVGGSTSIDVTKKGISKEYGVRQVLDLLNCSVEKAVYFGDSLEPGGNDEVVKNIDGLDVVAVDSEVETLSILQSI